MKLFLFSRKGAIYSINDERLAKSEVVNYVISAWVVDLASNLVVYNPYYLLDLP